MFESFFWKVTWWSILFEIIWPLICAVYWWQSNGGWRSRRHQKSYEQCIEKVSTTAIQASSSKQSHYREVPQWGVSNGARHNQKCFLAYKKFKFFFFFKFHIFLIRQNAPQIISFHLRYMQRYTFRVLQTIQMKVILLCVWAEPAVLGSTKTVLKFKCEI